MNGMQLVIRHTFITTAILRKLIELNTEQQMISDPTILTGHGEMSCFVVICIAYFHTELTY